MDATDQLLKRYSNVLFIILYNSLDESHPLKSLPINATFNQFYEECGWKVVEPPEKIHIFIVQTQVIRMCLSSQLPPFVKLQLKLSV